MNEKAAPLRRAALTQLTGRIDCAFTLSQATTQARSEASMASPDPKAIAAAYGGEARGDRVLVPSLGHSLRDRGTAIKVSPSAPDGVMVHCFNGEDPLAFKDDMRAKGLLPPRETSRRQEQQPNWKLIETYEYDDGEGQTVYRTKRYEDASWKPAAGEKRPKSFKVDRYESDQWIAGLGDVQRVPYRLTELRRAIADAQTIYFVEGERKVDKLVQMGFAATCIPFGAKSWRDEYAEHLRGARVCVLPDNDEPGRVFAAQVYKALAGVNAWPFILDLPNLPPAGDVIDWDGGSGELETLTKTAFDQAEPSWLDADGEQQDEMCALDLAALAKTRPEPKQFPLDPLAPAGETTVFSAGGGTGKSLIGQHLASASAGAIATCLGINLQPGPAIYLTCEDGAEELHWRQSKICRALNIPMETLAGKLHLVSLRGALDNHLATYERDGTLTPAPAFYRLERLIRKTGALTVWLDNISHLFTGDENNRGDVTRFINLLNGLAGETGAAIILLGHTNKAGDSWSGSTAWLNAVRSQITLERDPDTDVRTLKVGKANYRRMGESFRLVWVEGTFVREEDLAPDLRAELAEVGKANAENEAFLSCLRERAKQGVERAVGPSSGPNYAPSQFEGMAQARGFKRDAFKRAMDRLFDIGKIASEEVERPGKSGTKTIIVEVL